MYNLCCNLAYFNFDFNSVLSSHISIQYMNISLSSKCFASPLCLTNICNLNAESDGKSFRLREPAILQLIWTNWIRCHLQKLNCISLPIISSLFFSLSYFICFCVHVHRWKWNMDLSICSLWKCVHIMCFHVYFYV